MVLDCQCSCRGGNRPEAVIGLPRSQELHLHQALAAGFLSVFLSCHPWGHQPAGLQTMNSSLLFSVARRGVCIPCHTSVCPIPFP